MLRRAVVSCALLSLAVVGCGGGGDAPIDATVIDAQPIDSAPDA